MTKRQTIVADLAPPPGVPIPRPTGAMPVGQATRTRPMTDPAEKTAAYRAMGKSIPESDIDRLAEVVAARTSERQPTPAAPKRKPGLEAASGTATAQTDGTDNELMDADDDHDTPDRPLLSAVDFTVIALYLGFGMFTRAWTDITLQHDFDGNVALFAFAIGIVLALHAVIFIAVLRAWRAKWYRRGLNIVAMSTLAGYFVTQLIASL